MYVYSLFLPLTPAMNQNPSNAQNLWAPFAASWRYKLPEEKEKRKVEKDEKCDSRSNAKKILSSKTANDKRLEDAIVNENDWVINVSFPLALSLFRANIIALCVRSGINPSTLWPPEAILLNLNILYLKCIEENENSLEEFESRSTLFPTVFSSTTGENDNEEEPGLIRRYRSQRIVNIGRNLVDNVSV